MIAPAYPEFNIYSRVARRTTALGPLSVATSVSRMPGWMVEVIDENNYRKFGPRRPDGLPDHEALQWIRRADVVGLYGGLSSTIPRLYELAAYYKSDGVVTIAGGQHFAGENITNALTHGIDFVVLGEGEYTIAELLDAIVKGEEPDNVPGVAFLRDGEVVTTGERPPIEDFDALPLPDFGLLHYAKVKLFPVNWIRGCGMNCEFCTVKGRPRAASPRRVVEQVAALVETHNARKFFIVDDLFGHNRRDTLTLCRLLRRYQKAAGVRLDLTVQIRLDRGRDPELLKAMREAGITGVCIGFESPIAEELKAMDKRIKPQDMLEMTRHFHKAGFLVHGMFIFAYPLPPGIELTMTAKERVQAFRRFIRKSRLDTIQVLLPVPLPGTELTDRLKADNRVLPLDCIGWEYYDGNFPLFIPDPPLTPRDMQLAARRVMGRFYRFRSMFAIARNIVIFPAMMMTMWNIRFGWRKWRRSWRNNLIRFGGWMTLRRWVANLRKSRFPEKLAAAVNQVPRPRERSAHPDHD